MEQNLCHHPQWDASHVESVEWATSVGSVSASVFCMLWALHVALQHGTCALSMNVECVSVCKVWVMYWV